MRILLCYLLSLFLVQVTGANGQDVKGGFAGNWAKPHYYDTTLSPYKNGRFVVPIRSDQIGFVFHIPATVGVPPVPVRSTSAEVSDASGVVVRTLWQNRFYPAGEFGEIWDGLSDYGEKAVNGPFTIRLQYNGVQYRWDGVIGDNSPDVFSADTWGGITLGIPSDMATISDNAYAALGYNEGYYNSATFSMRDPTRHVKPFLPQTLSRDIFTRMTTDGRLVYFVNHTTDSSMGAGVVAFDKQGYLHNFSAGKILPGRGHFINRTDPQNLRYLVAQACDVVNYPSEMISGVAVQRDGDLLATAHGSSGVTLSADRINLWDKTTCAARGSMNISNPQRMAFDLNKNLWVISGNGIGGKNVLYKIANVSTQGSVSKPISVLDNPVALSVSPVNGHLFVADGGKNQQVFEFDLQRSTVVRTLGVPGGYGFGDKCNATVTKDKFWFDYGGRDPSTQVDTISSDTFVYADDRGGLEVEDPTTGQIRFYELVGGKWSYQKRIMFEAFQRTFAVDVNNPSRIFLGKGSMLEVVRDWSKPLVPGDPDSVESNGAWRMAHNWWPCIQSAPGYYAGVETPHTIFVWTSPDNGNTYLLSNDKPGKLAWNILHPDGTVTSKQQKNSYWPRVDSSGGYVRATYQAMHEQVWKVRLTGYDADQMPVWSGDKAPTATVFADHKHGDPITGAQLVTETRLAITHAATDDGTYVVYDQSVNHDVKGDLPAFHLGGIKPGDSTYRWKAMPQRDMAWSTGNGEFPAVELTGIAGEGGTVAAAGNEVFAMYEGNYAPTGACQFVHYHSDGLFIGQFGYMSSFSASANGEDPYGVNGVPSPALGEAKVPGFCGDVDDFQAVKVGHEIKIIHADESVFHGLHEWSIQHLDTITEISGAGSLGNAITLR